MNNWNGLHFVKFICVFFLILIHSFLYIISTKIFTIFNTESVFFQYAQNMMYFGYFIYLIPITAGILFRFNFKKNIVLKKDFNKILRMILFLVLISTLMNVILWGFKNIFDWNIIYFFSLSFLTLLLLLKIRFSSIFIFLIGIFLNIIYFFKFLIPNSLLDFYIFKILFGNNTIYFSWPFLAWFILVSFGFFIGDYYSKLKRRQFIFSLLIFGVIGLLISILLGDNLPTLNPVYIWGSGLFDPSFSMLLGVMSFSSLFLGFSTLCFNKINLSNRNIILIFSRMIFWIYVIQIIIGYPLLLLLKVFFNYNFLIENFLNFNNFLILMLHPVLMLFLSYFIGLWLYYFLKNKKIKINLRKSL